MRSKEIIFQSLSKKATTIVIIILSSISISLLNIFSTLIVRKLVDNVFTTPFEQGPNLAFWITSYIISLLFWFLLELVNKNKAITLGTYVTTSLSKAAYSASIRAEIGELQKFDRDEIVSKITQDCSKIGNEYIGQTWITFSRDIIFLVSIFVTMMVLNPVLGLITYVALPLFYMLVKSVEAFLNKFEIKTMKTLVDRERFIAEDFEKIRSIKIKNGIIKEEEDFFKYNQMYINSQKQYGGLKEVNDHKFFDLLIGLLFALIFGVGGYMSTRNQPIPGTIVAFVIMIPLIYKTFKELMALSISPRNIETEIVSIDELLSIKSELKSEPINSLDEVHSLRFQDVTYYGNENSIEGLNFELKRGEKLGVVSLDGDSKIVIFELLTKLIRPKDGVISINNCDINKLNTIYLRDIVTAVPQEHCLFNNTIAYNITYPFPFDEYKYNDALNKSGLKNILINYEEKDQTIIDEEHPLSEEMMQRITLANAFYKDSRIFILNDATSKLDVRSEEAIMKEVYKLKNKVVIIMSNKTYNIINCDKVLILDKEQVVEYGKVQDLLEDKNSVFSKLIKKVKPSKSARVS